MDALAHFSPIREERKKNLFLFLHAETDSSPLILGSLFKKI
jgi:hypothetical protein